MKEDITDFNSYKLQHNKNDTLDSVLNELRLFNKTQSEQSMANPFFEPDYNSVDELQKGLEILGLNFPIDKHTIRELKGIHIVKK